MTDWHGFGTALNIAQIYETTVTDSGSGLSAHFVIVPARSLGGDTYLFRGSVGPLGTVGLSRLADVPLGGVVHSLAACLVSRDVEEFLQRFHEGFEKESRHSDTMLPKHFEFAEYLTFARVIPFEWPFLSADSLGNILTAQGHGDAGYMHYEETDTPVLAIAIPAGIVICGAAPQVMEALAAGLRQHLLDLVNGHSHE